MLVRPAATVVEPTILRISAVMQTQNVIAAGKRHIAPVCRAPSKPNQTTPKPSNNYARAKQRGRGGSKPQRASHINAEEDETHMDLNQDDQVYVVRVASMLSLYWWTC